MSTITITKTSIPGDTSTDQPHTEASWKAAWILPQEVVDFGSPADASEGGRLAVREHAEALRQLRDS